MAVAEKKQGKISRKLLIHEKVEVRSTEEGLFGSWHSGQVIGYRDQVRHVMYDNIVNEDGLGTVEDVRVSSTLDGLISENSSYVRCKIRPFPPPFDLQKKSLQYGLCVDVHFNDAWWEGVVYDHKEGSDEWRIFFPDMGDEQTVKIDALRITRDWDEASGGWQARGKWILLEVLEEVNSYWPLAASAKQIWYEIRVKLGSSMVEWTHPDKDFWKAALRTALRGTYDLLMKQIVNELRFDGEFESCARKLPVSGFMFTLRHEDLLSDPEDEEVVSIGSGSSESMHMVDLSDVMADEVQSAQDNAVEAAYVGTGETRWNLADSHDIVPQCFPGSVQEYLRSRQDGEKVRNHLAYLRWRIETAMFGTVRKWRYISPDGHAHYSLRQVCLMLQCTHPVEPRNGGLIASRVIQVAKRREYSPRAEKSDLKEHDVIEVAKEYCLRAVEEYTQLSSNFKSGRMKGEGCLVSKARMHLSAVGWSFHYVKKRQNNKDKREMRYVSPNGRTFISLVSACKWYLTHGHSLASSSSTPHNASSSGQAKQFSPLRLESKQGTGKQAKLGNESKQVQVQVHGIGKGAILQQQQRKEDDLPVPVQPARTKPCQVAVSPTPHQAHNSRSILPRLIERNMVLPGDKVHYRSKGGLNMKEGRISREGIICCCCDRVFTLSRFEAHAGSTYHRPSAHIYLENGRSITDCLSQLNCEKQAENTTLALCPNKDNGHENPIPDSDYICSVCHAEGDLILCDQCPSSFHTGCVGLKDVPEGTWFCPSCCCRICNLVAVKHYKEEPSQESYLRCGQCEHQYHVKCLTSNGLTQPGGNWFCSSRCEQIHLGLQNLLGKPIHVGRDDLVCTLLKYKHINAPENECLTENYSKLSTALGIMRECFEPVSEARSGRDIVQDVIFNERSVLHRLNFLGFYTVVLERNNEIITVALLRIHGGKVAEMPLIATRFQCRRMGMCRILMNELEKKLTELGVERLILPAAPGVLETWENSFSFSRMLQSERLKFVGYTFLDFQGTTLCQKLLQSTPPPPDFRQLPEAEVVPEDKGTGTGTNDAAEVTPQQVDHPSCEYDKAMEEWDKTSKDGGEPETPQTDGFRCFKRRKLGIGESQNVF